MNPAFVFLIVRQYALAQFLSNFEAGDGDVLLVRRNITHKKYDEIALTRGVIKKPLIK